MGQMQNEDVELSSFTLDSLKYRKKASALAQRANLESDVEKVRAMLTLAAAWIQLAENEELMASESRTAMC
ncbi:hypothetical protein [Tardiphaga sp.]|uniref:hypothetical protein n=1 Tax=Tardiphaga sp. TaxID=1926292 RepID=UPI00262CE977|nr:hypothetical protein [Tardiphaga sp.]MDB5619068.1 hypothetical protein [Tardiphaga sp.]